MIRLWLPVAGAEDEWLPVDFAYAFQADSYMRRWHLARSAVQRERVRRDDTIVRGLSIPEADEAARQGRVAGAQRTPTKETTTDGS